MISIDAKMMTPTTTTTLLFLGAKRSSRWKIYVQNSTPASIPFSGRPKFGFGIGNQNQGTISWYVSVSEPNVFSETETFFSNFSYFMGEYKFL